MEQGKEIGKLARTVFPGGHFIPNGTNEAAAKSTQDAIADGRITVAFEYTFVVGSYAKAERAGFAEEGRPGLSISGHAHACNQVRGQFAITSLPTSTSGALAITFTQLCDDVAVPLIGLVQVQPQ